MYDQFVSIIDSQISVRASQPTIIGLATMNTPLCIQTHLNLTSNTITPSNEIQPVLFSPFKLAALDDVLAGALKSLIHPKRLQVGKLLAGTLQRIYNIEEQLHVLPRCCFMLEGEAMSNFCRGIYEQVSP